MAVPRHTCLALSRGMIDVVRCLSLGVALVFLQLGVANAEHATARDDAARRIAKDDRIMVFAQGQACAEACRREHSNCLIRSKGSPACNTRLQQCLQTCLANRRR